MALFIRIKSKVSLSEVLGCSKTPCLETLTCLERRNGGAEEILGMCVWIVVFQPDCVWESSSLKCLNFECNSEWHVITWLD